MTDAELQAIKERCEAATPSPWEEVAESGDWWITGPDAESNFVVGTSGTDREDVEFITHARTDVPALVAEVERLNAALTVEGELMAATHAHAGEVIAQLEAKEKEVAKLGLALALVPMYAAEIAESSGHVVVMPFDEWMARRQKGAVMMAAAEEYLSRPEVAAWLERTATENEAAVKRFMLEDLHG